jgi:hypothetical protein
MRKGKLKKRNKIRHKGKKEQNQIIKYTGYPAASAFGARNYNKYSED